MVIDNFDIINSCRICRSINQDEDYQNLYINIMDSDATDEDVVQLSETGRLYEELLEVTIDNESINLYPQYLCNSCDLQMRLFKKLKMKANKTLMELHKFYEKIRKSEIDKENYSENGLAEQQQHHVKNSLDTNSYTNEYNSIYRGNEEEFVCNINDRSLPSPLSNDCDINYLTDDNQTAEAKIDYQIQICQINNNSNNSLHQQDYETFNNSKADEEEMNMQLWENDSLTDNSAKLNKHKDKMNTNDDYYTADIESEFLLDETSCLVCNVQFDCLQTAKLHRKKHHDDKYACDKCNKLFHSLKSLKIHMNLHLGNLAYQCDLCQRSFNQKVHYQNHMNRHNNIRNFQCDMCEKTFFTKSDMKIHQRSHTGDRPYVCTICGKYYLILEHLKMHSYTHTQQKFECDICQQKFVSPSTLRQHKQTIHVAEPRFKCEQCCKPFRRKHHLMNHMKVHNKPSFNNETALDTRQLFDILSDDSVNNDDVIGVNGVDGTIDEYAGDCIESFNDEAGGCADADTDAYADADADPSNIKLFDPDIIVGEDDEMEMGYQNVMMETIEYL